MTEERLKKLLAAWPGAVVMRDGGEVRDGEHAIVLGGHVTQYGGEARYYNTATGVQYGGEASYYDTATGEQYGGWCWYEGESTGAQYGGEARYDANATGTVYGGEYEQWGDARVTDKRKG